MSNHRYTVISRGDDFDELLPPANIASPRQASRGARCCALAGAVLLLAAVVMAVAIPLALLSRSSSHMDTIHLAFERDHIEDHYEQKNPNSNQLHPQTVSLIGVGSINTTTTTEPTTSAATMTGPSTTSETTTTDPKLEATSTVSTNSSLSGMSSNSEIENTSNNSTNASSVSMMLGPLVNTDSSPQPNPQIVHKGDTGRVNQFQEQISTGLFEQSPISTSSEEQGSSSTAIKLRKWMKTVQKDPAFVPAAVAAVVLLILVAMVTAHAINRRIKRRNRRRHLGRLVTDLQQGDKVLLMASDEE